MYIPPYPHPTSLGMKSVQENTLCTCIKYLLLDSISTGLRGAIAYALALNLSERHHFGSQELLSTIATTTLVIVLFTIVVFGGSTLPILKVWIVREK